MDRIVRGRVLMEGLHPVSTSVLNGPDWTGERGQEWLAWRNEANRH